MAYIYQHLRKDTDQVFYIGIGQSNINFKRAYSRFDRNKWWHNITSKVDWEVKILIEDISWKQACDLEILLIKQLGRKDLNTGILVNMTDGGDGGRKMIFTKEMKDKQRLKKDCIKLQCINTVTGQCLEFDSISSACNELNLQKSNVLRCLKGITKTNKKWKFQKL